MELTGMFGELLGNCGSRRESFNRDSKIDSFRHYVDYIQLWPGCHWAFFTLACTGNVQEFSFGSGENQGEHEAPDY